MINYLSKGLFGKYFAKHFFTKEIDNRAYNNVE